MKKLGKPVPNLDKAAAIAKSIREAEASATQPPCVDFSDTKIAFGYKSDAELRETAWLFGLMNKPWLVNVLSSAGMWAVRWRLPFAGAITKRTIYRQFVGGSTLRESKPIIDRLYEHGILTALDYGVEGKEAEEDFNHTMKECLRAIDFAAMSPGIPVVSTKISGLASFGLLESIQSDGSLTIDQLQEYRTVLKRIDAICHAAEQKGVAIFIDAEESWIQDGIDRLATLMMQRYNQQRAVVYNTFQLYRHDRLQFLIDSYNRAQSDGYVLGAKLVRGAYMIKERTRAADMGYASPIHPSKAATDDAFNTALRFCLDHYETLAFCNASHNEASAQLQCRLIRERGLPAAHPHINFCQLYGMSDNLTFNLADAGYNVAKYVVYGPVREVVPYLVRRAQENTSVTGEANREYQLVQQELKRRGLQ